MRFEWVPPDWQTQSIAEAVAAASTANKVVLFAYDDGTEGVDRGGNDQNAGLPLPGWQDALISAVAAANPNTVVVLNTGDAVYMPWLASVKSVLEMWYPGVAGGVATADVLIGAVNPGGKLPITFPDGSAPRAAVPDRRPGLQPGGDRDPEQQHRHGRERRQLPALPGRVHEQPDAGQAHLPHRRHGGERHLPGLPLVRRARRQAPLFPFGHGLSYTTVRLLEPER